MIRFVPSTTMIVAACVLFVGCKQSGNGTRPPPATKQQPPDAGTAVIGQPSGTTAPGRGNSTGGN